MNNHRNGTDLNHSEIAQIVISSLREVLAMDSSNSPGASAITEDTFLIGREAVLDSMGLVTLVLADERALSQKNSPFRSVRSLTNYIYRESVSVPELHF
jgi:acyl carrier protein